MLSTGIFSRYSFLCNIFIFLPREDFSALCNGTPIIQQTLICRNQSIIQPLSVEAVLYNFSAGDSQFALLPRVVKKTGELFGKGSLIPFGHEVARYTIPNHDPAVLRLLGRKLPARGLEVVAATDGDGGLTLLLDLLLDLDVLVVDLDLPGRDAWSLLRLIRGAGGEEDLRVVVIADRPDAAVRARLLALGADAVADRADGPEEAARLALAAASSRRRLAPAERRRASPGRPWLPALPAASASAAASY